MTPAMVAPSVLTATRVSEVRTRLTWTDNTSDETGFKIEKCAGASCSDFSPLATLEAGRTSFDDSGLISNTSYSYRVAAYKTADCTWTSAYSNISSASTTLSDPDSLTATAVNTTRIYLAWNDNTSSETGFNIERCTGAPPCGSFSVIDTVLPDVSTYSDLSLCNSTQYTYRIMAQKAAGFTNDGGGCWTRRAPLTITNFAHDYTTEVILSYDADMQPDFSDIRFYDESAKVELPYWIQSKTDGVSATVLFKTMGNNNIYLYYGNASAVSSSDEGGVYAVYDPLEYYIDVSFTKDASNPVLAYGANGSWEDNYVMAPYVIKDSGTYKMWYDGHDGINSRIGYATSSDGTSWTKNASNPVLSLGTYGDWEDDKVGHTAVLKDESTYKMWYSGYNGSNWRIGYATSSDGVNWTKYASNPVLNLGAGGTWDDAHVLRPSVMKEGGVYKMWYSGHNGSNYRIGYATSNDGINWTRYASNPVLNLGSAGTWEDKHVYVSSVIKDSDGMYKIWYTGHDGSNTRIGYASSSDGISWTKYGSNPVLNRGVGGTWDDVHVHSPSMIKENGRYTMWYSGHDGAMWRIGRAHVQPRKSVSPSPSVSSGVEEQSVCYTFDNSWDTGYTNESSATTLAPSPPTVLLTTAVADSQADLAWTDNSIDETGFKIERCSGESCSPVDEIDTTSADSETYSDTTLDPETTYCYRVRAYKTAACGWNTLYTNESCDLTYSSHPTTLTATAVNSFMVQLDWVDNSSDEEGYEVEIQIFNGNFVKIATLGGNVTTFTDTMGVEPEKEYTYRVRAFRGADKSPYSNEATVTTPAWQEGDDTCE
jgi:predicted GH43/DUF377 family glycosyl hydrolase